MAESIEHKDKIIEQMKHEIAALREQVKLHEESFQAERRAYVAIRKEQTRLQRSCKTYELERDNAVKRARDSEAEADRLKILLREYEALIPPSSLCSKPEESNVQEPDVQKQSDNSDCDEPLHRSDVETDK